MKQFLAFMVLLLSFQCNASPKPVVNRRVLPDSHLITEIPDVSAQHDVVIPMDAGSLDSGQLLDAGIPVVRWSPTTIVRDFTTPTDAGLEVSNTQPYQQLLNLREGIVAIWTANIEENHHSSLAVFGRRLSPDGHWIGPIRRLKRLPTSVVDMVIDGYGEHLWIGYTTRRGRENTHALLQIRSDLTAVTPVVQVNSFRSNNAPPKELALVVTEAGTAHMLHCSGYREYVERDFDESQGGGAPSGNPTVTWEITNIDTNHHFFQTPIYSEEFDTSHSEVPDWYPRMIRVPSGGRYVLSVFGVDTMSGWVGNAGPGGSIANLRAVDAELALAWTNNTLYQVMLSADDHAGSIEQFTLHQTDGGRGDWQPGPTVTYTEHEMICENQRPILRLSNRTTNESVGLDLTFPGAVIPYNLVDLTIGEQVMNIPLLWTGTNIISFDGWAVHRWGCSGNRFVHLGESE